MAQFFIKKAKFLNLLTFLALNVFNPSIFICRIICRRVRGRDKPCSMYSTISTPKTQCFY